MWREADRDLDRIRERLTGWLASKLPQATDIRIAALTAPITNGFSNDTLFADLEWLESGERRTLASVLRLESSGETVFPAYDLASQFRVMQILADTDVPVPRTFWLETDRRILGAPFYVMGRVDGRIPSDTPPYHIAGWMTEVSEAERAAVWWSGLEVLARIHRLDVGKHGLDFLTPAALDASFHDRQPAYPDTTFLGRHIAYPDASFLEHQLAYYERYVAWASQGRPHTLCAAALEWLVRNRPADPERAGLCWGDARLGNMIFRDGLCVAVLDWEMAVIGDPEQDLAWWLYFDRHHSEGCDAERLAGLPSREESVQRYEEWTGRAVRHLDYYEIFAAFRFAAIMIRVAQQLVTRGILPPDSDFETNNTATRLLTRLLGDRVNAPRE